MARATYDEEFKRSAVNQVIVAGRSQAEVAASLGISYSGLGNWIRRYRQNAGEGDLSKDKELEELRKQNRKLQIENDILKKATAIFSKIHS